MQIFVKFDRTYTLDVQANDSVEKLRAAVADKIGAFAVEYVAMHHACKCLEDGRLLSDYNIQKETTIFCRGKSLQSGSPSNMDVEVSFRGLPLCFATQQSKKLAVDFAASVRSFKESIVSLGLLADKIEADDLILSSNGNDLVKDEAKIAFSGIREMSHPIIDVRLKQISSRWMNWVQAKLSTAQLDLREAIREEKKRALQQYKTVYKTVETKRQRIMEEVTDEHARFLFPLPHCNRYTTYRTTALSASDPRRILLERSVLASRAQHRNKPGSKKWCALPDIVVNRIEEVFNPRLLEKYTLELQHLQGLSRDGSSSIDCQLPNHVIKLEPSFGVNLNEFFLYHGAECHDDICRAGFDPRRGGQQAGKMFGRGSYFAENFSKADLYAGPEPFVCCKEEICVLIVRVALGESYGTEEAMPDIMLPPDREDADHPYDSVWAKTRDDGGSVDHREYVIYNGAQALPSFRVWYSHKGHCACARCKA